MAKNMRESDGFSNMFASLGLGSNTANNKPEKKKEETKAKENKLEEQKTQEKVTAEEETKTEHQGKTESQGTAKKAAKDATVTTATQKSNTNKTGSENKEAAKEVSTPITNDDRNRNINTDTNSATASQAKAKTETGISEGSSNEEKKSESKINNEETQNENTSVRLYARNKKYFEIRAAQLGVSQMEYINFLLEDEEEREKTEDLDPFSIELPKKESTSIKALVLTKHNMEFLRSASSHLGMKMTQFVNWMLDNERNREKKDGPRKSIK